MVFGPFRDGIDIFLAKYLRKREDEKGLSFGRLRDEGIEEEIEREQQRSQGDR